MPRHPPAVLDIVGASVIIQKLRAIEVECYAGGRADERPRRVIIDGRAHRVARLLEESLEEMSNSRAQRRRFKLLTNEGLLLEVVHVDGAWFLLSQSPETRT